MALECLTQPWKSLSQRAHAHDRLPPSYDLMSAGQYSSGRPDTHSIIVTYDTVRSRAHNVCRSGTYGPITYHMSRRAYGRGHEPKVSIL